MSNEHPADQSQWTTVDQTNDPEALVRFLSATRARTIEAQVIEGADHAYMGRERE